jgi:hypothetical protein
MAGADSILVVAPDNGVDTDSTTGDAQLARHSSALEPRGVWASKYRENIVDGLHDAPEAFLGLFSGRNLGKLIVRVDPDSR